MDDITFQTLVLEKLRRLDYKIDNMSIAFNRELFEQHSKVDKIENEVIRIDTERKTRDKTLDSVSDSSMNKRELVFGILGSIGMVIGLLMGIFL